MNIIWPWTANRVVKAYSTEADRLHEMNSKLEKKLKEAELRSRILKTEIQRLEAVLKTGHFRNPKTGRLGRKGDRFK
jgi:hypothetical protein